jgi:hypothetical protein
MLTGSSCCRLGPDGGGTRTSLLNLQRQSVERENVPARIDDFCEARFPDAANHRRLPALSRQMRRRTMMRKTLAVLATVTALGVTAIAAPAEAHGPGPGLAFGLAAGALTAGAIAASHPYGYYGPGYGYYDGPAYYAPGPVYYGAPYYRHRHYYRHW